MLHVLVEGGPRVFAAFIRAGLADELVLQLAPRLVGGDGLSWLGPLGLDRRAFRDALCMGRSWSQKYPNSSAWSCRAATRSGPALGCSDPGPR